MGNSQSVVDLFALGSVPVLLRAQTFLPSPFELASI